MYVVCLYSICHQEGDNDICMLCVYTVYATRKEIMIYVFVQNIRLGITTQSAYLPMH